MSRYISAYEQAQALVGGGYTDEQADILYRQLGGELTTPAQGEANWAQVQSAIWAIEGRTTR